MLTIDRMQADLRLSGAMPVREQTARRLERLARARVGEALETVAEGFSSDGEHIVIRRLDLRLWLDAGRLDDGQIAHLWAAALARALYRRLASGGPEQVRRYPDRAAFLAQYLADLAAGRADDAWQYQEFAPLLSLPDGRRAVAALSRDPDRIGPVLHRLAAARRLEAVIRCWTGPDIARLWRVWTGQPPHAPAQLPIRAVTRAAGLPPPIPEAGEGPDARGRLALRWLVALTAAPAGLPVLAAAPLAMQLAHAATLARALPGLRAAVAGGGRDRPALAALLASAPPGAAGGWLRQVLVHPGNGAGLARLLEIATGTSANSGPGPAPLQPRRIASPHAGLALLLPALRDLGLGGRLGPAGRLLLLAASIPFPARLPAQGDRLLRRLCALPPEAVLADLAPGIDWPAPASGEAPETAALHAVLSRFAHGLRGMESASPAYLCRQFLAGGGVLTEEAGVLRLRLDPVPLAILLRIGGRLGPQGPIPWLPGHDLLLEMRDG